MDLVTHNIQFETQGHTDIIDLTQKIQDVLSKSEFQEGFVQLFAIGSTTGLSTVEYEPGLVDNDIKNMMDKFAPYGHGYEHNKTWGDDNGAAHLRSTLTGTSMNVPFQNGKLILGTWQQIIFLDFDTRPRNRKVVAQFFGK